MSVWLSTLCNSSDSVGQIGEGAERDCNLCDSAARIDEMTESCGSVAEMAFSWSVIISFICG